MVTLVFWLFVVALTPVVFGLVGKLIAVIALGFWPGFEDPVPWVSSHALNFDHPSGCLTMAGRTSRPVTRR